MAAGLFFIWVTHSVVRGNLFSWHSSFQGKKTFFIAFLLALAAFLVGWYEDKPFVGASVGYFSFLFLLVGRALTVSYLEIVSVMFV